MDYQDDWKGAQWVTPMGGDQRVKNAMKAAAMIATKSHILLFI